MAIEPFLINPYRSRRRARRNAPKKAKRRVRAVVAARTHRGRAKLHLGPAHRPVLYGSGSSWVRSRWSRSKAGGVKLNPRRKHHRRYRHNPGQLVIAGSNPRRSRRRHFKRNPQLVVGGFDFMKNAPLIVVGGLSAVALVAIPHYFNLESKGTIVNYGAQAGVVVGGGYLLGKSLGVQYAYSWMLAGSAVILADVLRKYVLTSIFPTVFPSAAGFGAFPSRVASTRQISGLGAFSNTGYETLDVYPSGGNEGPY